MISNVCFVTNFGHWDLLTMALVASNVRPDWM